MPKTVRFDEVCIKYHDGKEKCYFDFHVNANILDDMIGWRIGSNYSKESKEYGVIVLPTYTLICKGNLDFFKE